MCVAILSIRILLETLLFGSYFLACVGVVARMLLRKESKCVHCTYDRRELFPSYRITNTAFLNVICIQ
jgi:hypothetical protein